MKNILLITGPAGASQGWGDYNTTKNIAAALEAKGKIPEILYVENVHQLIRRLKKMDFDLVWNALYHLEQKKDYVGCCLNELWVSDVLDDFEVPYIGPSAKTMKTLIDKAATLSELSKLGYNVHQQTSVPVGEKFDAYHFPLFVKPAYESESTGISESSVVHNAKELNDAINIIHKKYRQTALVEEYLPGNEYTVAVVGYGHNIKILPIENVIEKKGYKKYPLVTLQAKLSSAIDYKIPYTRQAELKTLVSSLAEDMKCYDHVRVDIRENSEGELRILEINGIPGLNPVKSRSLHCYELYDKDNRNIDELFENLVNDIVDMSIQRYIN